jgi:hypothetical protein
LYIIFSFSWCPAERSDSTGLGLLGPPAQKNVQTGTYRFTRFYISLIICRSEQVGVGAGSGEDIYRLSQQVEVKSPACTAFDVFAELSGESYVVHHFDRRHFRIRSSASFASHTLPFSMSSSDSAKGFLADTRLKSPGEQDIFDRFSCDRIPRIAGYSMVAIASLFVSFLQRKCKVVNQSGSDYFV